MLAAVENETPPAADALTRALKVLDDGLEVHPLAQELVQAKYLALVAAGDADEALAFVEAKAKEDPKGPFRRVLVEKLPRAEAIRPRRAAPRRAAPGVPRRVEPGRGAGAGRVARRRPRPRRAEQADRQRAAQGPGRRP